MASWPRPLPSLDNISVKLAVLKTKDPISVGGNSSFQVLRFAVLTWQQVQPICINQSSSNLTGLHPIQHSTLVNSFAVQFNTRRPKGSNFSIVHYCLFLSLLMTVT